MNEQGGDKRRQKERFEECREKEPTSFHCCKESVHR